MKEHSSAFDSLLSLIPAKYFYDDATQDQWQQKKASKAEAKQKKRAKFNPSIKENADEYLNSYATAKDVMENKLQKQSATHASEQEDGLNGIAQDTSSVVELEVPEKGEAEEEEEEEEEPILYYTILITFH